MKTFSLMAIASVAAHVAGIHFGFFVDDRALGMDYRINFFAFMLFLNTAIVLAWNAFPRKEEV